MTIPKGYQLPHSSPNTKVCKLNKTLLRKTPITTVGNVKLPRWSNRCEVRCDCMYETFPHGHATMIVSM